MTAAAEPDEFNNDALDYDIANAIGGLMIELCAEDDANTRDDFTENLPTKDIVKAWNNKDEYNDQQDNDNAYVDEVYEDIAILALSQAEYVNAHNRVLETISAMVMIKKSKILNCKVRL